MTAPTTALPPSHHAASTQEVYDKTLFGFWLYLMSDCLLFGTFFAAYAVLHNNVYGGPSSRELFNLPYALTETFILLTSSFTCGLGMLAAHRADKARVLAWFSVTFMLGIAFLAMELTEFTHLVQEGNSWQRSAFLSSFFTLVGTHGLHITCGLLWMLILMPQIMLRDLTAANFRKLACLSLFWHFLDIVWIFIFTIVYLMGVITL